MKHSVEEVKLKGGARGLLIDIPGATVMSTRVNFRAGMRYAKKPDLAEIAHLVEHLSFGANASFKDEQAYEAEFTKNGAYHNAWTSDYSVCYETECADFEWQRILDLKKVAIVSPRFNAEELRTEKQNVKSELTGYLNDYQRLLWPRLQQAIGENIPTLSERIKTINNIELRHIREHYRRTHTAENMRFIIAGQVHSRRRELIKMLNSWDLKPGERLNIPLDDLHQGDAVLIRRKDASNIHFGFSFLTPRRLEVSEYYTISCLNHILTGTMTSRIFGQARKLGLIYGLGSSVNNGHSDCSWDFEGEVNEESAEDLFLLIQQELNKVLNGDIADSDLDSAKSFITGRFQMGAQTVSQICDYYAETYFTAGDIEPYTKIPTIIEKITKQDMVDLAREFAGSGIKSLVAVASVEKSLINSLYAKLEI